MEKWSLVILFPPRFWFHAIDQTVWFRLKIFLVRGVPAEPAKQAGFRSGQYRVRIRHLYKYARQILDTLEMV